MTGYFEPMINGLIYGCALKIENKSDSDVSGVYSDAGLFLHFDADGSDYPLITAGMDDVVTIPANSIIYINKTFPAPFVAYNTCKLRVDSTSLPSTCYLTPILLIGTEAITNV